ncbi:hypothetical protein M2131_001297 [Polynucleobacter sphagniphilus]|jgi:hypothetical protein|uniref:hypothetical protein n=1 Tax=Polynucleobacter sphagniphilus TaxID=1743169 RepID=UPI002473EACC|nr:hypothetical protein [Polynucleobacter sphagniphilus]MDH6155009.1 hypothetical protein [Polynucleobacter sphagniphilus]MDH6248969.1 hypothetical protein [Polynucleobacter sphagniphilus]MDH6421356.1 hypothetical protein [Polynucleobacter sphagniphilus]
MKKLLSFVLLAIFLLVLGGCAASSTSPIGINCDDTKDLTINEMPLACQGGR